MMRGVGIGLAGLSGLSGMMGGESTLLTSLISYWKLDEASGTRYDAVTASANDLTDNNTVTQAAGVKGTDTAAQFTAANFESLTKASNASLQTGDIDFTLAGWVYRDSHGFQQPFGKRQNGTNREYFVDTSGGSPGVLRFQVSADGINAVNIAASAPTLSLSTWYFVVAWHDSVANTINIQVNNGTVYSTSHTTGVYVGTSQFAVGVAESGNYWNGRVARVALWKRVLTATERTNLYGGGTPPDYPFVGVP